MVVWASWIELKNFDGADRPAMSHSQRYAGGG